DPAASGSDPLAAAFASAFVPEGGDLDLREDSTFSGTLLVPMEGSWSAEGDTCALNAERWNGMTAEEYDREWEGGAQMPRRPTAPIRLRLNAGGTRLALLLDDGTTEEHYAYVRDKEAAPRPAAETRDQSGGD